MIESLSNYALAIICSSFLLNIIQMILPNGENRKYVLFVCSVIVTIILINPIINLLNKDLDVSELFEKNENLYTKIEEEKYQDYYENELINTYKNNIETDIVNRLENVGYKVHEIKCEYDKETNEPKYLRLQIEADSGIVQPVRIEVSSNSVMYKNELSSFDILKIKNILKATYGIEKVDINSED